MKTFSQRILLLFAVLFFAACGNQKNQSVQEKLIASYPSGKYFQPDAALTITFTKVPEKLKDLSSVKAASIITIQPAVKGNIYRVSEKTIVFQPEKALAFHQKYEVTLHLDKLFNHPDRKTFRFSIQTLPLELSLQLRQMTPFKVNRKAYARVSGDIYASGFVDAAKLKKSLSAFQADKALPVRISEINNRHFMVTVDSIERTDQPQKIKVVLNGKSLGAPVVLTKSYRVPSVKKFMFLQYNLIQKPQLHLELVFSDRIAPQQNLNGLIYFADGKPLDLSVKDNTVNIYPKTQLNGRHKLIIKKSIRSVQGHTLIRDYVLNPYFKMAPPQVRFIGKGNILPGKEKWIIPFETINLQAVDVIVFKIFANNVPQFLQDDDLSEGDNWTLRRVGEYIYHHHIVLADKNEKADNKWKSFAIDLSKMVQADPGAIYRISLRFRPSYSLLECSKNDTAETSFDSTAYYASSYYYPENYWWMNRDNPCDISYYTSNRFKTKNFLATNIGLTVKNSGPHDFLIFARDLISAKPLNKVKLTLYTYQNQKIASAVTNRQGEAKITADKKPFLLVAHQKNQFAYLKLTGGDALSYSKFNTSGTKTEKGLKGMIFGERGVWRPGDTLFLTFVMQDNQKILPADFPVKFSVYNARDKKVFTRVSTRGINGFYVFKIPTTTDAPTGIWRAVAKVGNHRFTKNLRIETVLPNRLKINFIAPGNRFTPESSPYMTLQSVWLNGGIASGLKASVTENMTVTKTRFKGYKNYVFDDPAKVFSPEEEPVFEGKLNNEGKARFKIDLPEKSGLPGMLRLTFVAKVFEAGGRFSIDQKSFLYAPFRTFVGIASPEPGNNGYLETGKPQKFKVATVDFAGHKVSVKKLKVEIYKLDWSWWYNSNNSNLASYISRNYKSRITSKIIHTSNGTGSFTFLVNYPQWGRYYIRVSDLKGGHSTGTIVYFDWPSSYGRKNRSQGDATLLSLSADKPVYHPGDEAVVSFPTPKGSRVLVSMEKNNRILKTWWKDAVSTQTSIRFKVTKAMTPNIYIYVSVIQPHLQTQNDLPIRAYGVIPIKVEDPKTFLYPKISMPDKLKPDQPYQITVSEARHRKMTYVLAVVDEGLLDLTHFKTPSLHDYFYRKEALAVNTWDYYNDVIGAYGIRLSQVFAIGGGNSVRELGRKKLNRFHPVVTFLGPFTLPKGSRGQTHKLKMPNYMGAVRVMVIAGNGRGAYGKAEKTVKVKQPLMVLASMPRALQPGETMNLPVTIFALEKSVQKVKLQVSGNALFSIQPKEQIVDFQQPGQKIALVRVKVNSQTGTGKVMIRVSSGNEKASYTVTVPVRNPNKRVYHTKNYSLDAGQTIRTKPDLVPGTSAGKMAFTVSKIPPVNLEKRLQYLVQYPYGCIEQTVSSAFVQLYLNRLTQLSGNQQSKIEKDENHAIQQLLEMQAYNGGFPYWPGGTTISDWGTSYAGNYLLLAKENGYYVPAEMLNRWILYQQKTANEWNGKTNRYGRYIDDLNQAYRLYTLALAGKPAMSAMNRMRGMQHLSSAALLRLAAAYALLNEQNAAKMLLQQVKNSPKEETNNWDISFGSTVRNEALALETWLLTGNKTKAFPLFTDIAGALGSDQWMSTQTTAYALYAVALFAGNQSGEQSFTFKWKYGNTKVTAQSKKPVYLKTLTPQPGKTLSVQNTSQQTLFLNVETSGIPLPGKIVNEQQNLRLKVTYYDMNGRAISPEDLKQGKDFYAKVDVFNPTLRNVKNMALTFVVPSGWEILNTRMLDVGNNLHSSSYDYLDIRDDRVNIFFSLDYKSKKHFYILLNASYPGTFFLPPVSCQAMYDHSIQATMGGGTVKVNN